MRGKVLDKGQIRAVVGITPARAGKSLFLEICEHELRDHPRACGEKLDGNTKTEDMQGSPPRVRGKD